MKQATLLLAVFLCLSTAAQQPGNIVSNNLPAYHPVKFEGLKKFKLSEQSYDISGITKLHSFTLARPETPAFNFKPLQAYLSEDIRYYHLEQKKKEWTQFSSGLLNSWQKQQWLDNKNNIQQKWMAQKIKGK
jgi:hypothetical protein